MPSFTIAEIAAQLAAEHAGQQDLVIRRASEPATAGPDDLALAMDPSYGAALAAGRARAAVLWPGADWQALGLKAAIFAPRPRLALASITGAFARAPNLPEGIHPSTVIDASAEIAPDARIGPFCLIGAGVKIGAGARILSHVSIAEGSEIGPDALLFSGVRIGSNVRIGRGFIAHYNAVIGSDGFSFVTPEPSGAEQARREFRADPPQTAQQYRRIASTGSVTLGDHVELGAGSTIDKGTIADTRVGDGTKIDNHVQIGHNVRIGRDCLLCAHVAVAGSSVLGDRVVLGGQAGVGDHLVVGDDVIAAGATAILSNVPRGRVMMGYPAMPMQANIASYKALRRLPRLMAKLADRQKPVSKPGKKP